MDFARFRPSRPRWRDTLFACAIALVVLHFYLPQVRAAASPLVFNNDARQLIVPLYPYYDPSLMPGDYAGEYYRRVFLPPGYKLLYRGLAVAVDPALVSKVMPYALMLVFALAMGRAAYIAGGRIACWAVVVSLLSTDFFFESMGGGHGHGFGLALHALVVLSLFANSARLLALAAVLGAAFYPVVAVLAGSTLALLLAAPRALGGFETSLSPGRRLALVAATALLAGAIVLPQLLAARDYGPMTPIHDEAYPEVSESGRFRWLPISPRELPGAVASRGLRAAGQIFHADAMAALLLVALVVAARRDLAARRVLVLIAVAAAGSLTATFFAPHLFFPGRYLRYVVPTALLASVAFLVRRLLGFGARMGRPGRAMPAVVAVGFGLMALLGPNRVRAQTGQSVDVRKDAPFYRFVASLPPDTTLAGWPRGMMDSVQYVARRKVLVSYETHQVFHLAYVQEMRRRTRALIEAYFAVDPAPLVALRERFGVDILVVEEQYLRGPAPPRYFAPFDAWIEEAWRGAKRDPRGIQALRLSPDAIVFQHRGAIAIDLHRLPSASPRTPL